MGNEEAPSALKEWECSVWPCVQFSGLRLATAHLVLALLLQPDALLSVGALDDSFQGHGGGVNDNCSRRLPLAFLMLHFCSNTRNITLLVAGCAAMEQQNKNDCLSAVEKL